MRRHESRSRSTACVAPERPLKTLKRPAWRVKYSRTGRKTTHNQSINENNNSLDFLTVFCTSSQASLMIELFLYSAIDCLLLCKLSGATCTPTEKRDLDSCGLSQFHLLWVLRNIFPRPLFWSAFKPSCEQPATPHTLQPPALNFSCRCFENKSLYQYKSRYGYFY